jgi:hypothetical protein
MLLGHLLQYTPAASCAGIHATSLNAKVADGGHGQEQVPSGHVSLTQSGSQSERTAATSLVWSQYDTDKTWPGGTQGILSLSEGAKPG